MELFLRKIIEPSLLAVFLRFIFTDACDEKSIVDCLTIRLRTQSKVHDETHETSCLLLCGLVHYNQVVLFLN